MKYKKEGFFFVCVSFFSCFLFYFTYYKIHVGVSGHDL